MANKTVKKPDRLLRRSDFLRVKDAGKKWVSPTVIVQAGPSDTSGGETPGIRFGITATKKIGNAVMRNKVKRRLRAAVRKILKTSEQKSADIVLIGRDATATCPFETLVKDLKWCLKKLELG